MATTPLFADRVQETSTTTGTGTYTLAGAVTGYQTFAAIGNGISCYYCAMEVDANGNPSGGWEVGVGTYTSSGTTLSRDSILASTNSNAAVSWAAGTRRIFVTHAATTAVQASAGLAPTAEGRIGFDTTQHALVAGGQGTISGKIPRVLTSQHNVTDTLTAATISTTETQFSKTLQIPADFFIAGKALRVFCGFQFTSSSSAPTIIFRCRLGAVGIAGTIVFQGSTASIGTSLTNQGGGLAFYIVGTAAPGAAVDVITTLHGNVAANPVSRQTVAQPVAVATNGALNINITLQYSANTAGNTTTLLTFIVEELN